jgi:hypothetical protein
MMMNDRQSIAYAHDYQQSQWMGKYDSTCYEAMAHPWERRQLKISALVGFREQVT